ncbi:amino acid/polyamine/organocation transporter, APC superfamily [Cellulosimicrobium aquatile]|uniref:APC family permease n=2 Tax=Cellulosimicrobium TaxID=157920 RepID=A0A4Y8R7J0_9MICO|nr:MULTISPECIES: APC family permease [Cellulosimicrobium]TGA78344.1 APC family permease [Cellulosimicrobium terreum]ARK05669.1 DNA-binding protein [Cellulosimicrobium sp. TH-20]KFD44158.1 DNA-binding protein [Cellulosimicrobium sp. MM]MCM3535666.1 APC family permease [Cellulosimicrobium funkei]NMF28630.1 APC family permease [Cellulosimicrobium aquatile]
MSEIADAAKRLLLGRPVRSEHLGHTLLPKRVALPVFASDALSSVAYAPDEILLTLALAGLSATMISPWVGLAVVVVLLTVVASYRQNVRAYPSGGGDYEVATVNLGPTAGVGVASALMVDYVLTVAVSISSGAQYAASAIPALRDHEAAFAIGLVVLLTLVNLRGVKESGTFFAIPVYLFMLAIGTTAVVGFFQYVTGNLGPAESAEFELTAESGFDQGLMGIAGAFLVARAFASGCAALTGVEAISNGVPAFRKPKSRNAATTLALLGGISAAMMLSILFLARATGVHYAEDPHAQLSLNGEPLPVDYVQHPVIGQLAETVFSGAPILFYVVSAVTGLILVLAANTAFNGFPVLGSILAKDGYLPRQLHTRGDRLAFSNGIITLAVAAIVLIWAFDAEVTRLIQLYIVGVFVSFTLSQLGMVRHWTRALRTEHQPRERSRMRRSRVVNTVGLGMTGTVLVIVLLTKFTHGAWIAILAMAIVFVLMKSIRKHYDTVRDELALGDDAAAARALPSRVHAIVLVSKIHRPTMRALAYARASRPSVLEAVTVGVDAEDVEDLMRQWEALDLPVPLRVLDSPFREITRPVLSYVRSVRRESPRDLVVVYIPEYVVGHWWEQLLHNQSALRLKGRLLFTPGVVVASVPWQLSSTEGQTGLEGEGFRQRFTGY